MADNFTDVVKIGMGTAIMGVILILISGLFLPIIGLMIILVSMILGGLVVAICMGIITAVEETT
jgi:hypothetical protein